MGAIFDGANVRVTVLCDNSSKEGYPLKKDSSSMQTIMHPQLVSFAAPGLLPSLTCHRKSAFDIYHSGAQRAHCGAVDRGISQK